jgi:hypothetical protein
MARAFLVLLAAGAALGGCASAPPPQVIYVDRYPPPPPPPPRVMMTPRHHPECSPPGYAMRPPPTPPGPRYHPYGPKSTPKGNGHRVPMRRLGHPMGHPIYNVRYWAQR